MNRLAPTRDAAPRPSGWLTGLALAAASATLLLGLHGGALAAKAPPGVFPPAPVAAAPAVPLQFDIVGFIQEASLDTASTICNASHPLLRGGLLKVNGREIVVPCNTILQMPATSLTWAELFDPSLVDASGGTSGTPVTRLALADAITAPVTGSAYPYNGVLPSYEVRVQGNVVKGRYIAGLIFISQQSLNAGFGVINCIDYANGELHVGGAAGVCASSDTRVRINDPVGRFGQSHGKPGSTADLKEAGYDRRLTADTDNPTIKAETGYPMCLPRKNPFGKVADDPVHNGFDPLCPQGNRPRAPYCTSLGDPFPNFAQPATGQYCHTWTMDPPDCATCTTDPTQQAPFVIGDPIDYAGTLKVDATGPYLSAHTITAHLGIYTTPGTRPSYVALEETLQGTGSLPIANLPQESTSRVKIEGMVSDPSMMVDLYAVDVDPVTGTTSERLLGTANPSGPPVVGRFRFKPNAGAYLPATRELRAVSRSMCGDNAIVCAMPGTSQPFWSNVAQPLAFANGLIAGQYRAPDFDFIFAEPTVVGDPMVPANFQDLPFLYCGSGPLGTMTVNGTGPVVGQLDPAPWDTPMIDPVFRSTLCPTARSVGSLPPPPRRQLFDTVTIVTANYDNKALKGKLSVVATDSLPSNTNGLQLYIQVSGLAFDPNTGLGTVVSLSSVPQPMSLVRNVAGSPAVCPSASPCWVYDATGVINNPADPGFFAAPISITVTSNMGARATIDSTRITVR
ncbi:hypothetical protein [Leptothrix discophora]|uniref:Uncharacterized protein n=1 Tax=Leptothrix discophora TaxID=89 RepID=A0ABT9G2J6_LEPDI|nr:hypothetical protein [Leptothrix discophora]MDP4300393.1 hypothetical protein [Leptothrix discophora]